MKNMTHALFRTFDVNKLDQSTVYTKVFKNRSVAYYGNCQYTYGVTTRNPNDWCGNLYLQQLLS